MFKANLALERNKGVVASVSQSGPEVTLAFSCSEPYGARFEVALGTRDINLLIMALYKAKEESRLKEREWED